jgi:hypothetical protein
MANGRSLPALICSIVSASEPDMASTCLPSRAVTAGAPPSNGTSVAVVPAPLNSSAWDSWPPVPTPAVAYLTTSGVIANSDLTASAML